MHFSKCTHERVCIKNCQKHKGDVKRRRKLQYLLMDNDAQCTKLVQCHIGKWQDLFFVM